MSRLDDESKQNIIFGVENPNHHITTNTSFICSASNPKTSLPHKSANMSPALGIGFRAFFCVVDDATPAAGIGTGADDKAAVGIAVAAAVVVDDDDDDDNDDDDDTALFTAAGARFVALPALRSAGTLSFTLGEETPDVAGEVDDTAAAGATPPAAAAADDDDDDDDCAAAAAAAAEVVDAEAKSPFILGSLSLFLFFARAVTAASTISPSSHVFCTASAGCCCQYSW